MYEIGVKVFFYYSFACLFVCIYAPEHVYMCKYMHIFFS